MNNFWAVVELMGHVRHIGFVTEVELFGSKLGQVEALNHDGTSQTHIFNAASIYQITPVTEQQARNMVPIYAPALPAGTLRTCRVCGCSELDTGEPRSWAEDDLCSACVGMVKCPGCRRGNTEEYDPWWRCPICDSYADGYKIITREQAEAYIADHPEYAPYYDLNIKEQAMAEEEGAEAAQAVQAPEASRRACPNAEYDPFKDDGDGIDGYYTCRPDCDLCRGSAYIKDCPACKGTGFDVFEDDDTKCPNCEGKRTVPA